MLLNTVALTFPRLREKAREERGAMGIWEAMVSTADGVRRRLPDPAPVKKACYSVYGLGAAAVHAVRANSPDGQNRIARTTWNLLDHALEYGTRPYTGGIPAYRILKEELFSSDHPTASGTELNDIRKRLEKLEDLEAARGAERTAAETWTLFGTLFKQNK